MHLKHSIFCLIALLSSCTSEEQQNDSETPDYSTYLIKGKLEFIESLEKSNSAEASFEPLGTLYIDTVLPFSEKGLDKLAPQHLEIRKANIDEIKLSIAQLELDYEEYVRNDSKLRDQANEKLFGKKEFKDKINSNYDEALKLEQQIDLLKIELVQEKKYLDSIIKAINDTPLRKQDFLMKNDTLGFVVFYKYINENGVHKSYSNYLLFDRNNDVFIF